MGLSETESLEMAGIITVHPEGAIAIEEVTG